MSVIDKVIAAVTPPESEEDRREARARAREAASRCAWLREVLDHHEGIERAFAEAKAAPDAASRRAAHRKLGELLTAHAIAEEAAIYPAMSESGESGNATLAYAQQSGAKMEMGLLEGLDPMSEDYADKLAHIEGAVQHHVYEEEGRWFVQLVEEAPADGHALIAARYREEYERYMGGGERGAAMAGQGGYALADEAGSQARGESGLFRG